jgi:hypothetical protein
MNKHTLIYLFLGLNSVFAGDIPITGTFRATPEDPAAHIQKLVISANGICDVTYSYVEFQRSLKLGKLEQTDKRVNKEARGKVEYSAKVEEYFDKVEAAHIKEFGPDSPLTKDIKSKIAVFRNLGYEGVIILNFQTETGAGFAVLIQKGDLLIDLNNGLKLKKAWW